MQNFTKLSILRSAKQNNIQYIRLEFSDMLGTIKAVEIPVSKLEDALDGKIMFDGSSIEGFVRIKEADMFLRPDLRTWLLLSFEKSTYGKVARLICDVYNIHGRPFKGDPRYILKTQIKKLKKLGFQNLNVGFEPEFYLFKLSSEGEPIITTNDKGSYFDLAPLDGSEYVRRDITLQLASLGFDVQTSHHEVGPGQNEVNFRFSNVLEACDRVQTFKQVVKIIAREHGYYASFMPKPITNMAGSGMHTNCSLQTMENLNAFYDPKMDMGLSHTCLKWMTGIMKHARGISVFTNPSVNSYKRLVIGYEAPCYICWSDANRSSMIRIPATRGAGTRTELRHVDPLANPYLTLALILAAGMDGIENISDNEIIKPVHDNIFDLTREEREKNGILNLPENLKDAIKAAEKDPLVIETLGEHTYNKYMEAKRREWEEYRKIVSEWEIKRFI